MGPNSRENTGTMFESEINRLFFPEDEDTEQDVTENDAQENDLEHENEQE